MSVSVSGFVPDFDQTSVAKASALLLTYGLQCEIDPTCIQEIVGWNGILPVAVRVTDLTFFKGKITPEFFSGFEFSVEHFAFLSQDFRANFNQADFPGVLECLRVCGKKITVTTSALSAGGSIGAAFCAAIVEAAGGVLCDEEGGSCYSSDGIVRKVLALGWCDELADIDLSDLEVFSGW